MPAKPLTQEQLQDAERLHKAFLEFQEQMRARGQPLSQEAAAELLPFGQSAMNQYLKGKIPLNPEALLAFCALLDASPMDISPSITKAQIDWALRWISPKLAAEEAVRRAASAPPKPKALTVDETALKFANLFLRLPERDRKVALALVTAMQADG